MNNVYCLYFKSYCYHISGLVNSVSSKIVSVVLPPASLQLVGKVFKRVKIKHSSLLVYYKGLYLQHIYQEYQYLLLLKLSVISVLYLDLNETFSECNADTVGQIVQYIMKNEGKCDLVCLFSYSIFGHIFGFFVLEEIVVCSIMR